MRRGGFGGARRSAWYVGGVTGALMLWLWLLAATLLLPTAKAATPIRINTGGAAQTVDGVGWIGCTNLNACNGFVSGGYPYTQSPRPTISDVSTPANETIYQSEWTGGEKGPNAVATGATAFSFTIPVANGNYLVRLHFAELNKNGAGLRVFDVNIEGGSSELTNFDVFVAAGGMHKAIVREFSTVIADGNVTIEFIRQVENAKISAIEIIPLAADTPTPTDTLIPTSTDIPTPTPTDTPAPPSTELPSPTSEALPTSDPLTPTSDGLTPTTDPLTPTIDVPTNSATFTPTATNTLMPTPMDTATPSPTRTATPSPSSPTPTPIRATPLTWHTLASIPQARFEAQGAAVNGKLYVLGGYYANSPIRATVRADVYDPATNRWTRIADMPEPLSHSAQAVDGDTIYLVGGYVGNHPGPSTAHVWRYNTRTNTWSAGPSLPAGRGAGAVALIGRSLHFVGGATRTQNKTDETDQANHYVLNLDGGTQWTSAAALPNPRNHLAAVTFDGKLYAIGGQHRREEGTTNQNQVDVYDPATNRWTRAANLPVPRGHISSSTFVKDGRIIVIGGSINNGSGGAPSADVTAYDPATNTWSMLTPLPSGRKTPVADVINGRIYVATGTNPSATSTNWGGW